MSFNLINTLSLDDKKRIENYIYTYGTRKEDFIGLNEWLKYWSQSKIKLFKLLGNRILIKEPIVYEKTERELKFQLDKLVYKNKEETIIDVIIPWIDKNENKLINISLSELSQFIQTCLNITVLVRDELPSAIKFKIKGQKKTFQAQKKAKPIRTLGKLISYCSSFEGYEEIAEIFEKFRIAHSLILNDKRVRANLVISIHPLDFMTMSDNASNWRSCMSWKEEGCYRIGTVEMMNSNNVLCCYLADINTPLSFLKDYKEMEYDEPMESSELYTWTNKKWRQLIYCTKDIIVSGKSYPYANDDITKIIIQKVRELAQKNLGWNYVFGPERYQDMKHISSLEEMNQIRAYIHNKDTQKHNIIFDTKGMYNDMLNDHHFHYWCVRNKVKKNKIISYSGKTSCLCCGEPVVWENEDLCSTWGDPEGYNDKYNNCDELICPDCWSDRNHCYCDICGDDSWKTKYFHLIDENGKELKICSDCYKRHVHTCPEYKGV